MTCSNDLPCGACIICMLRNSINLFRKLFIFEMLLVIFSMNNLTPVVREVLKIDIEFFSKSVLLILCMFFILYSFTQKLQFALSRRWAYQITVGLYLAICAYAIVSSSPLTLGLILYFPFLVIRVFLVLLSQHPSKRNPKQ